jgi:hypothetical protein
VGEQVFHVHAVHDTVVTSIKVSLIRSKVRNVSSMGASVGGRTEPAMGNWEGRSERSAKA